MKASASASREGGGSRDIAALGDLRGGHEGDATGFRTAVHRLVSRVCLTIYSTEYIASTVRERSMAIERAGEPFAAMLSPAAATRRNSLISGSLLGRRLEIVTAPPAEPAVKRRLRIYELNSNLHCSIVGTCLSTGDLRQLL